mgnify:FL=1
MKKDQIRVMDRLIGQCHEAYQARTPLIMVDTEEVELMRRLAREGGLVDLLQAAGQDAYYGHYYAYVGIQPDSLELCSNFFEDTEPLEELSEHGGSMSYEKPSALFLLHLTQNVRSTVNKSEGDLLAALRRYVNRYVSCRNVSSPLRNSCVLLYGDPGLLPRDLKPYTEVFTAEYPKTWEIMEIICALAAENGHPYENSNDARELALQMTGFSLIQVERFVQRLLWVDSEDGQPLLFSKKREELLLDAKAQAVRGSGGLLQLYRENNPPPSKVPEQKAGLSAEKPPADDLAAMDAYKRWAQEAGRRMDQKNRHEYTLTRGVPALKGVLLCGVPGCGKSEAAKILWRQWKTPMLRMDMDQLMGGLVGESERNLRQALAQAEAMAPCILWIDELEKGFSGAASAGGDGGTFKRMFGRLLTWMQENTKPCFIFATANDISQLPPEFFRSGRFDALFSVFMPTNNECKNIFKEHMRRAQNLREKAAKEQGIGGRIPPLFQDDKDMGCFTDGALQKIMDVVMEGKNPERPDGVKFLSGADIQKITLCALTKIPDSKLGAPIDLPTWLEALRTVIQDPATTTLGSSSASLDQIAANYVRLIRGNFAPASSKDQVLFQKEFYTCRVTEQKEVVVQYTGACTMTQPYDRALFNALRGRIETIGSRVEANALRRLSE